jgi:hypothetical protein
VLVSKEKSSAGRSNIINTKGELEIKGAENGKQQRVGICNLAQPLCHPLSNNHNNVHWCSRPCQIITTLLPCSRATLLSLWENYFHSEPALSLCTQSLLFCQRASITLYRRDRETANKKSVIAKRRAVTFKESQIVFIFCWKECAVSNMGWHLDLSNFTTYHTQTLRNSTPIWAIELNKGQSCAVYKLYMHDPVW